MERRAFKFFKYFAKHAEDTEVKKLCVRLADIELQHMDAIEDMLSQWRDIPLTDQDVKTLNAKKTVKSLFVPIPDKGINKSGLLEFVMAQEDKIVDYYDKFLNKVSSGWKMRQLESIKIKSEQHYLTLNDMMLKLRSVRDDFSVYDQEERKPQLVLYHNFKRKKVS
jgi:rubrerythrin